MRAIVLDAGGAGDFCLVDMDVPALRKGEVGISVKSISFNPIDVQLRKNPPEGRRAAALILGRDLSGVVEAVHEDVSGLSPGDEVYSYICTLASSGAYAEYVAVPAELVAKKPRALSHDQAAAVPVAAITARLALEKVNAVACRSLFVAGGAGGVGTFAVMLARQLGVRRLVTTAGGAASRSYLRDKLGLADAKIVNYRDRDVVQQAISANGGSFDGVLDLVGGRMLSICCRLVGVDGHLASAVEAPGREDFEHLFRKNASFHAVGANAYSLSDDRADWLKYRVALESLARLFDAGALRPPHVANVGAFSVETVKKAHDLLERSAVQGKLVMSVT